MISDRVEMRQVDGVASLSLHRITADDSGKYIVMAENTFGMDCHYASLAVEGKLLIYLEEEKYEFQCLNEMELQVHRIRAANRLFVK